ncbi:MAG: hypothetical protein HGA96_04955 [Desulfobulbaceae bacterium]|nr:hypothetical protein [Desulfobulbaceae bacterium]
MSDINHTAVVVLTSEYKISGFIDLMPGSRLTDYITSARSYFAITEVVVEDVRTGKTMFRGKFVDINRDSVVMILPADICQDCR